MRKRLQGKIALITGAASGIGAACAELFSHEGAIVIATDIDDTAGLQTVSKIGGNTQYLHLDVSNEIHWKETEKFIKDKYSHLDILINNAGITGMNTEGEPLDPEHTSLKSWQEIHQVNLDSVFMGCKMAISLMKNHGGSIINMSSRSGLVGIPGAAAYASSKAAIRNHTKSVALYAARYGIRCNSIHPALILTPMWKPMLGESVQEQERNLAALVQDVPLQRAGTPLDVAYLAVYLASDESSYVTGSEFNIDGGLLAGAGAAPTRKTD